MYTYIYIYICWFILAFCELKQFEFRLRREFANSKALCPTRLFVLLLALSLAISLAIKVALALCDAVSSHSTFDLQGMAATRHPTKTSCHWYCKSAVQGRWSAWTWCIMTLHQAVQSQVSEAYADSPAGASCNEGHVQLRTFCNKSYAICHHIDARHEHAYLQNALAAWQGIERCLYIIGINEHMDVIDCPLDSVCRTVQSTLHICT